MLNELGCRRWELSALMQLRLFWLLRVVVATFSLRSFSSSKFHHIWLFSSLQLSKPILEHKDLVFYTHYWVCDFHLTDGRRWAIFSTFWWPTLWLLKVLGALFTKCLNKVNRQRLWLVLLLLDHLVFTNGIPLTTLHSGRSYVSKRCSLVLILRIYFGCVVHASYVVMWASHGGRFGMTGWD